MSGALLSGALLMLGCALLYFPVHACHDRAQPALHHKTNTRPHLASHSGAHAIAARRVAPLAAPLSPPFCASFFACLLAENPTGPTPCPQPHLHSLLQRPATVAVCTQDHARSHGLPNIQHGLGVRERVFPAAHLQCGLGVFIYLFIYLSFIYLLGGWVGYYEQMGGSVLCTYAHVHLWFPLQRNVNSLPDWVSGRGSTHLQLESSVALVHQLQGC